MKRSILKLAVFGLLATAIALGPTQGFAQEKKEKPAAEKQGGSKADRALPFHGKITAIDQSAKTIALGERVFQITADTKVVKDGKAASLADAAVGDQVGGSYTKSDDGKLTARSLRIGPKPEGEAKGAGKKKKKAKAE